jgi:hypothetical protein
MQDKRDCEITRLAEFVDQFLEEFVLGDHIYLLPPPLNFIKLEFQREKMAAPADKLPELPLDPPRVLGETKPVNVLHQTSLLEALRARMEIVADRSHYEANPSGHLASLRQADGHLRKIMSGLPADTHPELRHYLERQSYAKAVHWLETHLAG